MKKWVLAIGIVCSLTGYAQNKETATPQWRPVYHFTPEKNWTNDPNGLIYMDGVYHLYNQQNPFENKWGHMSWGHASSTDLVHWQHLPIALPETIDKDSSWRFSGCTVLDKNNTSGFCKSGGCLVAIYTADQPNLKKESQFIAYSNDGGMHYTNYENNPVLDLGIKDFRDPNVSWNEQLQQWLMVVALPTEYKLRFYASKNLRDWSLLSEFGSAGYSKAPWECPSLIKLKVKNQPSLEKWVLMVSSGGPNGWPFMQYFTGRFDGKQFINDNPAETILTVDEGDCFYAAIPWNNTPEDKKILIGWLTPGAQATSPWTGQMSVPRDLALLQTPQGLRLTQTPSSVIKSKLNTIAGKKLFSVSSAKTAVSQAFLKTIPQPAGNAWWLSATWVPVAGSVSGFKIAQQFDASDNVVHEITVGYDADRKELFVDKTNAENAGLYKNKKRHVVKIENVQELIGMEILFDKSSLEVFLNNGEKVISTMVYPAENANGISPFTTGQEPVFKSIEIWDMNGIKK